MFTLILRSALFLLILETFYRLHAGWIKKSSEELIVKGKGEAFCTYCAVTLRAHKDSLKDHAKSENHAKATSELVRDNQGRGQATIAQAFGK